MELLQEYGQSSDKRWEQYSNQQLIALFNRRFHELYDTQPCFADWSNRQMLIEQLNKLY